MFRVADAPVAGCAHDVLLPYAPTLEDFRAPLWTTLWRMPIMNY
jgi:hypothetical protein